jgi:hypothetical protein
MCTLAACAAVTIVFAGCASSGESYAEISMNEKPAQPGHVFVYDFAATVEDVSVGAPLAARLSNRPSLSPEQVALERQLGADMSAQLIQAIRSMGLPAERALPGATPQINDVVVRGYLLSIHETNATKRVTVGLDPAASEFAMAVENFQIAPQGFGRSLGSGSGTEGEKALGAAIGAETNPAGHIVTSGMKVDRESNRPKVEAWAKQSVVEIADRLKARFQEKRWIN